MLNGTKIAMFPKRFFITIVGIVLKRLSCEEMVLNGIRLQFHAPCSLLNLTELIFSIMEFTDKSNLINKTIDNTIQYIMNILLITFMTITSKIGIKCKPLL